jgi:hypothetical protein
MGVVHRCAFGLEGAKEEALAIGQLELGMLQEALLVEVLLEAFDLSVELLALAGEELGLKDDPPRRWTWLASGTQPPVTSQFSLGTAR